MSLKKEKRRLSKALVQTAFEFRHLNCPAGCHKHHIALFKDGEQMTPATDNPAEALQFASDYFAQGVKAFNGFLTDANTGKDVGTSEKSDDSDIDAFADELVKEITSLLGPGVKVSVLARRKASDQADSVAKATPAATETNQTAG